MELKDLVNVKVGSAVREVRRGEVYVVNLDEDGQNLVGSEQKGTRPAVIISNNIGNKVAPVCEVVYITTASKPKLPTHVSVTAPGVYCTVLCEGIDTISKKRLGKRICLLSEQQMKAVDKALGVSIGISSKPVVKVESSENKQDSIPDGSFMQIEDSSSSYVEDQLIRCIKTILQLRLDLREVNKEISKIMESNIVLTGIEESYLNDEVENEIKRKVAERATKKKLQLEKNATKLFKFICAESLNAVTEKDKEESPKKSSVQRGGEQGTRLLR